MKNDIIDGLTHLMMERSMVWELNHTFMTLVPKIQGVEHMDEFQPISCVNTFYKIHAKMLGDRLAEVVTLLQSKNHATFVSGRLTRDQFKLGKDMVNGFNRKATPKWFCMSVVLKKAFDNIS